MAKIEEIEYVYSLLITKEPTEFLERLNDTNAGIGAVLKIISESDREISAGDLAQKMYVSTARIAVLLRKMETKGLIVKASSADDGRKVIVRLTEKGECTIEKAKAMIYEHIEMLIDNIGMERMKTFLEINAEIESLTRGKTQKIDFN